jgi:hypothetical protein
MICNCLKHEADQGPADALMFDYRGYIAKPPANVFFVQDGAAKFDPIVS